MPLTPGCMPGTQVRLNFLSTLIDEAYAHLHYHLCASVLGVKLFTMPFNRDVVVTQAAARDMRASMAYCQQVCGGGEWGTYC